MRTYYDQSDVQRIIEQLAVRIAAAFAPADPLNIIGVRTRGETVAQRLTVILEKQGFGRIARGVLDITMYRDDLSNQGLARMPHPTEIDISLDDIPMILVDDVLFTGRSARAALNALVDFGRPQVIRLAVLVDRSGRELPIQSDFTGLTIGDVPPDHRVNVHLTETDGKDEIVVEPKA